MKTNDFHDINFSNSTTAIIKFISWCNFWKYWIRCADDNFIRNHTFERKTVDRDKTRRTVQKFYFLFKNTAQNKEHLFVKISSRCRGNCLLVFTFLISCRSEIYCHSLKCFCFISPLHLLTRYFFTFIFAIPAVSSTSQSYLISQPICFYIMFKIWNTVDDKSFLSSQILK